MPDALLDQIDEMRAAIALKDETIASLHAQVAQLRRLVFGQSSEKAALAVPAYGAAQLDAFAGWRGSRSRRLGHEPQRGDPHAGRRGDPQKAHSREQHHHRRGQRDRDARGRYGPALRHRRAPYWARRSRASPNTGAAPIAE